jgi:hypothetical protein
MRILSCHATPVGGVLRVAKKNRWDRSKYPDDWERKSYDQRSSTNWTCEFCGAVHGGEGTTRGGNTYKPVRIAAAHKWPHDESNPNPDLYSLCQSCHFSYDAQFRGIIAEGDHQVAMHRILLEPVFGDYGEERFWCDICNGYYLEHSHDDD